jgi:hypothetical protein
MMPAIIERVGTGKVSPPVSMRAPERDAIGAASRIVNISGIANHAAAGAVVFLSRGNRVSKTLNRW